MAVLRSLPPSLLLGFAAVLAAILPYFFAGDDWIYSGRWASFIGLLAIIIARVLFINMRQRRYADGVYAESIALTGGFLLAVIALANSLLDPNAAVVHGAPGESAPIPGTNVQVQFQAPNSHGDTPVTLRSADGRTITLEGHGRKIFRSTLVQLGAEDSAQVAVTDLQGRTLTLTRPTGGGFLAPLYLFRTHTQIAGRDLPTDALAVPTENQRLVGFLIDRSTAQTDHYARLTSGLPGILFDVQSADGRTVPQGIGFVADGATTIVARLRISVHLAPYPTVLAASVPSPGATLLGLFAYVAAASTVIVRRYRQPAAVL